MWRSAESLGLEEGLDTNPWNSFVQRLLNSFIRLNIEEDTLVWAKSSINGEYTVSLGYSAMILAGGQQDVFW